MLVLLPLPQYFLSFLQPFKCLSLSLSLFFVLSLHSPAFPFSVSHRKHLATNIFQFLSPPSKAKPLLICIKIFRFVHRRFRGWSVFHFSTLEKSSLEYFPMLADGIDQWKSLSLLSRILGFASIHEKIFSCFKKS